MKTMKTTATAALALILVGGASDAARGATNEYEIAWTGIGIYPRTGPSLDSTRASRAVPDGTRVRIACETDGQAVSNGYNISTIWERLEDGSYLPNAFINTGVDGYTPGIRRCAALDSGSRDEQVDRSVLDGKVYAPPGLNVPLSEALLNYYYSGHGQDVVIDWSYFESSHRLLEHLYNLPADSRSRVYHSTSRDDGDIYWALGAFSVARTSEHCFVIGDDYDFTPNKVPNMPFFFNWMDAQIGRAAEFDIKAYSCLDY